MKPIVTLVFGLALTGAALPGLAQQTGSAEAKPGRHAQIDTNGDGAIDRAEAAKMPRLAEHFDRLDANKDGRISAEERPQRGGKGARHGGRGGQQMAALDANKDGAIDRAEAAKMPRFAEHFDRLDANKDGRISAEERPQRGGKGGHGRGGQPRAKLDRNGDGRLGRDEVAGREAILQRFDTIDGNKDGYLTREEMQAHREAHRGQRAAKP